MVENLSESAVVGVSAVVLAFSSALAVYLIVLHIKHCYYPAAQRLCLILFAMPILIGWVSWIDLVTLDQINIILYTINLYKSVCVVTFVLYIDRLIGWTDSEGTNQYSSAKVEDVLLSMRRADCYLKCFWPTPLETRDQVKKYRFRTRACILQFPVVLTLAGVIGLLIFLSVDERVASPEARMDSFWLWLTVFQVLSSVVAVNALINYAVFADKIPELAGLSILRKFILIKVSMILTEMQPLVITLFAASGFIADTSEYTIEEIVQYTNSLLLCSEMIIAGFLQVLVFPVDEYRESPMYRKSVAIAAELSVYTRLQRPLQEQ